MFTVAFCCNKYSKLRCPQYASEGDRIAQALKTWKQVSTCSSTRCQPKLSDCVLHFCRSFFSNLVKPVVVAKYTEQYFSVAGWPAFWMEVKETISWHKLT